MNTLQINVNNLIIQSELNLDYLKKEEKEEIQKKKG